MYLSEASAAYTAGLSRHQCNTTVRKLNTRPRKRLGFRTPLECFNES
jgi:IS30 family transposase